MENSTKVLFTSSEPDFHLATSAYMDDTLWIDETREGLQETLGLSIEFFRINDIQINRCKSELIVINPKTGYNKASIIMGSDNAVVKAKKRNQEVRFLGI